MISIKEAADLLLSWDDILVVSHSSPDGDTLGSASALLRALTYLGKKVNFDCADKYGKKFSYLFDGIEFSENFAHIVAVDVADPKLLGNIYEKYSGKIELCIDHHRTHVPFAKNEHVDPKAAANCQIIYTLINAMNVPIDSDMASCIFTGLSTDTGCFKYSNVTPETHIIAAKLIELGANASEINRLMFDTKTRACMEVERQVLAKMEFHFNDQLALISIPADLIKAAGAEESELEGLPSIPRMIEGVKLGICLKEKDTGLWKASVRATPPYDASRVCAQLGGGGHKGAAGCALTNDLEESKAMLLKACQEQL